MSVETVAVIGGGGQMGCGIAQVAAVAGFDVRLIDVTEHDIARGVGRIESSLKRMVARGTLTAEASAAARNRIAPGTDIAAAADCFFAFESVPEDIEIKGSTLTALDVVCMPDTTIASNTSQMSISNLATLVKRPERVIGMHWFNPPPLMRLIEIVPGIETSPATLQSATSITTRLGKEAVVCKKDAAGFLTSRLIMAFNLEAVRILDEGIATVDDINRACQLAFNHPMGPLAMVDLGGLETFEHAADGLRNAYGDRFLAPQLLRALVRAGHLGRKTGRGFSDYGAAR